MLPRCPALLSNSLFLLRCVLWANKVMMRDSVGGWSAQRERGSKSPGLSEQHVLRHHTVHQSVRLPRQRRQSCNRPRAVVMHAHQSRPKPVVGGRPWTTTARHRSQIHQRSQSFLYVH